MAPSSPGSSPGAAPLPPLPSLSGGGQGATSTPSGAASGGLAGVISGLTPVKTGVEMILAGCQQVVKSGAVPGSEQICGQIVSLATSLLTMAAQYAMQPGQAGGLTGVQGGGGPQGL